MSALMPELISLGLDVLMAGLLVAVMLYCHKVNKNIKVLQDSKNEMAKLFAEFDASIEKAADSVQELQTATQKAEGILKDKLDKANLVADDLTFMIERGIKMADQLEGGSKKPAAPAATKPTAPSGNTSRPAAAPQQRQAAPKPQEEAKKPWPLGGGKAPANNPKAGGAPKDNKSARTTASIESVLEQMANRNNPADAKDKAGDKKPSNRIRSKAEQELFDSLKSGR